MDKGQIIIFLGVIGAIYLLNFTFGIVEILPDNLPLVGNIDEGVASLLVIAALKEFNIDVVGTIERI